MILRQPAALAHLGRAENAKSTHSLLIFKFIKEIKVAQALKCGSQLKSWSERNKSLLTGILVKLEVHFIQVKMRND